MTWQSRSCFVRTSIESRRAFIASTDWIRPGLKVTIRGVRGKEWKNIQFVGFIKEEHWHFLDKPRWRLLSSP
jgi:hypothetical protein